MKKIILLVSFLFSMLTLTGQNLIQNGSFENTTCDLCSTFSEFFDGCVTDWQAYAYAPEAFDSSDPSCTFFNGGYYYAPHLDQHAMVGPNSGIFQAGDFQPGTYTISFRYTRGEALFTNYPIYINVGFADGLVNVDWNDTSNASIPIENVVSKLVDEDDPVNWATYTGTFTLNQAYENVVIYGSFEMKNANMEKAPTRRALIDNFVLECDDCCKPEDIIVTADGENITDTLTYTIPCGETCVTLNATNVQNAVYNTTDPVLNDLQGLFCVTDPAMTSFTATITGEDSCGDPITRQVVVNIEQDCPPVDECCTEENNLLANGNFDNATCGGNDAIDNCVPEWFATQLSPSVNGFGTNPHAWMWSYSGFGEGIATNFDFQEGVEYTICFRVRTDDKNTGDPNVANHATINLVATNNAGSITATPNGDVIFNDVMGPYLNQWTDVSVTFTPDADYSQLWVFPFMQNGSTGGSQSEMSIDDIIVAQCCDEQEISIVPFWAHPECPEVVCEADQWPIHVLDQNGTPITSAGGVVIEWTNQNTGAVLNQDFVFAQPNETWTVVVTYPNGCEYTATYFEDCCNDDVFIEAIVCPTEADLLAYESQLAAKRNTMSAEEYQKRLDVLDQMKREEPAKECDPCDIGWVLIKLVDANGNDINPANYTSIVWSDGGSGTMRLIPVDTTISVTATQVDGENECVYTAEFIYPCDDKCDGLTAPTNLQVVGTTLTWDPVPGATSYIVTSPAGNEPQIFCECINQVSIVPLTTTTNSVVLPAGLENACFVWRVQAVCPDGTTSPNSSQMCYGTVIRKDVETFEEVILSPNPSSGDVNISIASAKGGRAVVEIYNFYGSIIDRMTVDITAHEMKSIYWNKRGRLSKGIYLVTITIGDETVRKKLIIE
jgi:hypothetical protein